MDPNVEAILEQYEAKHGISGVRTNKDTVESLFAEFTASGRIQPVSTTSIEQTNPTLAAYGVPEDDPWKKMNLEQKAATGFVYSIGWAPTRALEAIGIGDTPTLREFAAQEVSGLENLGEFIDRGARGVADFVAEDTPWLWDTTYLVARRAPELLWSTGMMAIGQPGAAGLLSTERAVPYETKGSKIDPWVTGALSAVEYFNFMRGTAGGYRRHAGSLAQAMSLPNVKLGLATDLVRRSAYAGLYGQLQGNALDPKRFLTDSLTHFVIMGASGLVKHGLEDAILRRTPETTRKVLEGPWLPRAVDKVLRIGGQKGRYLMVERADDWVESVFEQSRIAWTERDKRPFYVTFLAGLPAALAFNYWTESFGDLGNLGASGSMDSIKAQMRGSVEAAVREIGRPITDEEQTAVNIFYNTVDDPGRFKTAIERGGFGKISEHLITLLVDVETDSLTPFTEEQRAEEHAKQLEMTRQSSLGPPLVARLDKQQPTPPEDEPAPPLSIHREAPMAVTPAGGELARVMRLDPQTVRTQGKEKHIGAPAIKRHLTAMGLTQDDIELAKEEDKKRQLQWSFENIQMAPIIRRWDASDAREYVAPGLLAQMQGLKPDQLANRAGALVKGDRASKGTKFALPLFREELKAENSLLRSIRSADMFGYAKQLLGEVQTPLLDALRDEKMVFRYDLDERTLVEEELEGAPASVKRHFKRARPGMMLGENDLSLDEAYEELSNAGMIGTGQNYMAIVTTAVEEAQRRAAKPDFNAIVQKGLEEEQASQQENPDAPMELHDLMQQLDQTRGRMTELQERLQDLVALDESRVARPDIDERIRQLEDRQSELEAVGDELTLPRKEQLKSQIAAAGGVIEALKSIIAQQHAGIPAKKSDIKKEFTRRHVSKTRMRGIIAVATKEAAEPTNDLAKVNDIEQLDAIKAMALREPFATASAVALAKRYAVKPFNKPDVLDMLRNNKIRGRGAQGKVTIKDVQAVYEGVHSRDAFKGETDELTGAAIYALFEEVEAENALPEERAPLDTSLRLKKRWQQNAYELTVRPWAWARRADGRKEGGPNQEILSRASRALGRAKLGIHTMTDNLAAKIKELGLSLPELENDVIPMAYRVNMTHNDALKLYVVRGDNGWKERLFDAGVTEDDWVSVMRELPDNVKQLGDWMQEQYQRYWGMSNERYMQLKGRELGYVHGFGGTLDYVDAPYAEMVDAFTEEMLKRRRLGLSASLPGAPGPSRTGSPKMMPQLNATQSFLRDATNYETFYHCGEAAYQLHALISDNRWRELARAYIELGPVALDYIDDWYQQSFGMGGSEKVTTANKAFGTARGNTSMALIALNFLSLPRAGLSMLTSIGHIRSPKLALFHGKAMLRYIGGMPEMVRKGRHAMDEELTLRAPELAKKHFIGRATEYVKIAVKNMENPMLTQLHKEAEHTIGRAGGLRDVYELKEAQRIENVGKKVSSMLRMLQNLQTVAMLPYRVIDEATVSCCWWGHHDYHIDSGRTEEEASRLATDAVDRTQPAPRKFDLPKLWRSGDMWSALTMFQNQVNNQFMQLGEEAIGDLHHAMRRHSGVPDRLYDLLWRYLFSGILTSFALGAISAGRMLTKEEMVRDQGIYTIGLVPVLGWLSTEHWKGYGFTNPPVFEPVKETLGVTHALGKKQFGKAAAHAYPAVGMMLGLPVSQPRRTARFVHALMTGKHPMWRRAIWSSYALRPQGFTQNAFELLQEWQVPRSRWDQIRGTGTDGKVTVNDVRRIRR